MADAAMIEARFHEHNSQSVALGSDPRIRSTCVAEFSPAQLSRNTTFFSIASRPMCSLLAGKSGSG